MSWPPSVLVVDDVEMNLEYMRRRLAQYGIRADLARDGLQARLAIERKFYDLIFLDIYMPILTGLEALREIRRIHKDHMYVVGVSATLNASAADQMMEYGFDEFHQQPIPTAELERILARFREDGQPPTPTEEPA